MNKLFTFYFLYHVKQMQFVALQSSYSLIQWSVVSTNFRKRLFGQIGNPVGHDRWPTIISITASVSYFEKSTWKHLQEGWKNQGFEPPSIYNPLYDQLRFLPLFRSPTFGNIFSTISLSMKYQIHTKINSCGKVSSKKQRYMLFYKKYFYKQHQTEI